MFLLFRAEYMTQIIAQPMTPTGKGGSSIMQYRKNRGEYGFQ